MNGQSLQSRTYATIIIDIIIMHIQLIFNSYYHCNYGRYTLAGKFLMRCKISCFSREEQLINYWDNSMRYVFHMNYN